MPSSGRKLSSYDTASAKFSLAPKPAMVFAREDSPVYLMRFDLMAAMLDNQPKVQAAFKSGGGMAWGDRAGRMFGAVARFFRPGYHNKSGAGLAAGPGWGRCQARARGISCRPRLRPWLVHRPDGESVPELPVCRLRFFMPVLSPRRGRTPKRRVCRPTRASVGKGLCRQGVRSRHVLRRLA